MEKMFAWGIAARLGQTDIRGFTTEVHEFDYKKPQVDTAIHECFVAVPDLVASTA